MFGHAAAAMLPRQMDLKYDEKLRFTKKYLLNSLRWRNSFDGWKTSVFLRAFGGFQIKFMFGEFAYRIQTSYVFTF